MMTLEEAKAECGRWFAYLERQRLRSLELQQLASARRAGILTLEEANQRMHQMDTITVYDGAELEKAVKVLLKHLDQY